APKPPAPTSRTWASSAGTALWLLLARAARWSPSRSATPACPPLRLRRVSASTIDDEPEDSMPKHPSASVIASDAEPGAEPVSWEEVRQRFDAERWYWVATAGAGGGAQGRPRPGGRGAATGNSPPHPPRRPGR